MWGLGEESWPSALTPYTGAGTVWSRRQGVQSEARPVVTRAATITVIALLVVAIARLGSSDDAQTATVARIIDGDTLVTTDGTTVRLIGFDAPEAGECGGHEATRALAELVDGETVTLTPGPEPRDDYGRALRHVSVGSQGISVAMVRRGWGETLTIPPNDAHAGAIAEAEREARRGGRGMWGEPCTTS